MTELEWVKVMDDGLKDEVCETYYTEYEDKELVIRSIWKSPIEVKVIAYIAHGHPTEEVLYKYQRTLLCLDKDRLFQKVNEITSYKKCELKSIATERDFLI